MSPSELQAWIRLSSIVVVYVPYTAYVAALFARDGPLARPLCFAFLAAPIAFLVANAGGELLTRTFHRCSRDDERDRAIAGVSMRVAYTALVVLVLGALSTYAVLGILTPPSADGRIPTPGYAIASQFAFVSIVVAEALRHATQVVCYRRGLPA